MSERQEEQGGLGSSLMIFLLGVAVGATVAILYAPAAGSETRAQIAEKAGQFKDRAGELTSQAAEKAGQLRDKAGEWTEKAVSRIRRTEDVSETAQLDAAEGSSGMTGA